MLIFKYALNILQLIFQTPFHEFSCLHMLIVKLSRKINELQCNSRFAVVWKAHFHHQDHLDFVKHLIHFYLLKKIYINS